jgi:hypothetical protein
MTTQLPLSWLLLLLLASVLLLLLPCHCSNMPASSKAMIALTTTCSAPAAAQHAV